MLPYSSAVSQKITNQNITKFNKTPVTAEMADYDIAV